MLNHAVDARIAYLTIVLAKRSFAFSCPSGVECAFLLYEIGVLGFGMRPIVFVTYSRNGGLRWGTAVDLTLPPAVVYNLPMNETLPTMESVATLREHWVSIAARLEETSNYARDGAGKRGIVTRAVRELAAERNLAVSTVWRFLSAVRHLRKLNDIALAHSNGQLQLSSAEVGPESIQYLAMLYDVMDADDFYQTLQRVANGTLGRDSLRLLWKTFADLRRNRRPGSFDRAREIKVLGRILTGSADWLEVERAKMLPGVTVQSPQNGTLVIFDAVAIEKERTTGRLNFHGLFVRGTEHTDEYIASARNLCHFVWVGRHSGEFAPNWPMSGIGIGRFEFDAATHEIVVDRRAEKFEDPRGLGDLAIALLSSELGFAV